MNLLPAGTVTFLFTDIEGSTRLAQEQPGSFGALLERHHAILQGAIEGHGGYIFQIIGDAFCAAFHTVREALDAALDAQQQLSAEDWSPVPIRVRMGISTGSAQVKLQDGRPADYSGYLTLARAQRVMSVAYGGQILLSMASTELVRGELPEAVSLRDMGEHRLKSLLNPERLSQVLAPGLQAQFPPLASLNAIPNNLPLQLTSFVGRERELVEIRRLLETHRLVTLSGAGGTGKTRLALQLAAEIVDEFRDGAWFVELAPISDPDLIVPTMLRVFALPSQPGREPLEILSDHLAGKSLLLILDNSEHLLDPCCRLVQALLQAAPGLKIVATSREALNLGGEQAYRVPSLALPDVRQLPPLEQLTQYEAVHLFVERAILVDPVFTVTKANAPAVAQLCSRLDGIPLAIELASARLKSMSLDLIVSRLDDRFRLLTGGSRIALPRQQTLHAMIDWSYALLSQRENSLFQRVSVFRGGCTVEAAEAVCSGEGIASPDVLDLLARLVDKSLLMLDERGRYEMLETVRHFGQERLIESGHAALARDRHLAYFLQLAEQAEPGLRSFHQVKWLERVDAELDNLRAALSWALERDPKSCIRLAAALWRYWDIRTSHEEGAEWLENALNVARGLDDATRLRALVALCHLQGCAFAAQTRCTGEDAFALASRLGDLRSMVLSLVELGDPALYAEPDKAAARADQALMLARQSGDPWLVANSLLMVGYAAEWRNDLPRACAFLEESVKEARKCGDQQLALTPLFQLRPLKFALGDVETAERYAEEALPVAERLGDHRKVAACKAGPVLVALQRGQFSQAMGHAQEAYEYVQAHSLLDLMNSIKWYEATAAWGLGDAPAFVALMQDALATAERLGDRLTLILSLCRLAYAFLFKGELEQARQTCTRALDGVREAGTAFGYCSCMQAIGSLALHEGHAERAVRLFAARARRRESTFAVDWLLPMVREREKLLAQARSQLGEEAFAAAWEAGQALTQAEALTLAGDILGEARAVSSA